VAARSEAGVEATSCSGAGDKTKGGSGGAMVSRARAERERAQGRKFAKCSKRECGA
jgi:hypothetical protein